MRKRTLIAAKNLHFFATFFRFTSKFHFSISTLNQFSHEKLYGEEITRRKLIRHLQESTKLQSLSTTKAFHALTITLGSDPSQPVFPSNSIMSRYAAIGEVSTAHKLFDFMPERNVVSYNTMIKAYSSVGGLEEAWKMLSEMRGCGFKPTEFSFCGILTCASMALVQGFQLLALILKCGNLYTDAFVGTAMLGVLGSHGCLDEAIRVFEEMPKKNLVTWNCLISLFGQHGLVEDSILLFHELMSCGMALSESTFVGALSGLTGVLDLQLGEQLHSVGVKYGLDGSVLVSNSFTNMYAKCADIDSAEKMFKGVLVKDIVSWNTVIGAMAKSDRQEKAFEIFLSMCNAGTLPNQTTIVSVLNSCSSLKFPSYGQYIHGKTIKTNLETDVYVGSSLVDFYAKCGTLEDAHLCFVRITHKNVVSWNSLIAVYSNKGSLSSLLLLRDMIHLGYCPNEFSFSSVLKSCVALEVQQLHSLIMKMGFQDNEYVWSSLITSYAKNGFLADALTFVQPYNTPLPVVLCNVIAAVYNRSRQYERTQELFSALEDPDIVSWNILIAACSRNGDYEEAFELFDHMQRASIRPDNYTYVSLFSACTKLCNLSLGSSLHGLILKSDFTICDTFLCNVVIDMYAKCGNFQSSVKIFYEMTNKNAISWTAIISGHGLHGCAHEALRVFERMLMEGFKPDNVTFLAVLSACRHAGLVKQGMQMFKQMKSNYKIEPEMDHYHLAVDLLARYGHVKEAEELINQMPFPPNALVWRSFLEGCRRKRTIDSTTAFQTEVIQ
ncbi:hypothetical protein M9H77_21128 [Catharanthus roseus]|uniref:Uncharacterized protein n=1 Tax=Catharanthus roseus TaxID=4058 RepID=A0ACC0ANH9_CATRO|nr:hypothetical protein M9H77_21128 [Catharanthus roseus]